MFPTVAVQGDSNVVGSLSDAGQRANVNDRKRSKSIASGGSSTLNIYAVFVWTGPCADVGSMLGHVILFKGIHSSTILSSGQA